MAKVFIQENIIYAQKQIDDGGFVVVNGYNSPKRPLMSSLRRSSSILFIRRGLSKYIYYISKGDLNFLRGLCSYPNIIFTFVEPKNHDILIYPATLWAIIHRYCQKRKYLLQRVADILTQSTLGYCSYLIWKMRLSYQLLALNS